MFSLKSELETHQYTRTVPAEHKAHWSITSHCYVFIMMENVNKTNPCVNVSNVT